VETGAEAGADPARTAGAEIGAGIPDAAEAAQGWTPMDSKGRKLNGGDPPWREHPTEDSEASDFAVEFIQKEKKKKKKKKKKKDKAEGGAGAAKKEKKKKKKKKERSGEVEL